MLQYEAIVVEAFRLFPDEFALRGYPEYPDSSDVHKPLYGILKRRGLVRAAQKTFALTTKGVETADQLGTGASLNDARSPDRMTRPVKSEVERMLGSAALSLFVAGTPQRILDTDFYNFLGCTVRTPPNDFLGRLATTMDAVRIAAKLGQPSPEQADQLEKTWSFLEKQFKQQIDRRKEGK